MLNEKVRGQYKPTGWGAHQLPSGLLPPPLLLCLLLHPLLSTSRASAGGLIGPIICLWPLSAALLILAIRLLQQSLTHLPKHRLLGSMVISKWGWVGRSRGVTGGDKRWMGLTWVAACSVVGRASCRSSFSASFARCSSTSWASRSRAWAGVRVGGEFKCQNCPSDPTLSLNLSRGPSSWLCPPHTPSRHSWATLPFTPCWALVRWSIP